MLKKYARRKRLLRRMKSRGKWKHGKSNVAKVRRLEEARAHLKQASLDSQIQT